MSDVLQRRIWVEQIMGMPVSVHLRGACPAGRPSFVDDLFAELRELDLLFSTYRPESQISRIADGVLDREDCDPVVTEVLELCASATVLTGGWFDVMLPTPDGRRLDPSGLVKGWAVERVATRLGERWKGDYYVNAGGDIALSSRSGEPWRIGVENPVTGGLLAVVPLTSGGIATSGTAHRGEHIFDPTTGRPATALRSVTVIGPSLMWADVLATAAFARGHGASNWVSRHEGYRAVVLSDDGTVST
jgi:thiamine biosynthesis lipoprotein